MIVQDELVHCIPSGHWYETLLTLITSTYAVYPYAVYPYVVRDQILETVPNHISNSVYFCMYLMVFICNSRIFLKISAIAIHKFNIRT